MNEQIFFTISHILLIIIILSLSFILLKKLKQEKFQKF